MILNLVPFLQDNKYIIMFLIIFALVFSLLMMWIIARNNKKKKNINTIASIGIFSAFSIILYYIKFNLPFIFPSFLEVNFSLLPVIIIGYMLGPVEAVTIVLIRAVIKIPFTSTFCVGEIADLLIGIPVAIVTSLIYKKNHTKKGALISLLIGSLVWVSVSVLTNIFINVPFFLEMYFNGNVESFLGVLSVIPGVTVDNYLIKYVLYAVIPFNLILSITVSIVTFLVYKKISILFNKLQKKQEAYE